MSGTRTPWRLAVGLALLAVVLCAPSLQNGLFLDDHIHGASLSHPPDLPQIHTTPDLLFSFVSDKRDFLLDDKPWWTSDDLKLSFWRPLAGLSHWLDHRLWPESPFLMHLHSLLWLGLTAFLATLAFARFLAPGPDLQSGRPSPAWVPGLAALLFAVDEVHAWPAMWIANRNALLSMAFGLAALIAHDRDRRDGWAAGVWVAPVCLLLAVLAGESAVACGAYLVAYALFLDPKAGLHGLRALWPTATVGALWLLAYKLQGFGARGSASYVDPLTDPLRFADALVERVPILVLGLWSPIPADLYLVLPRDARFQLWAVAVALLLILGLWMWRWIGRDPRAGFLALGFAGSLVPASIVLPMNRQLLYASFGAVGLLALLIGEAGRRRRALGWALVTPLILLHVIVAPLSLLAVSKVFEDLPTLIENGVRSLPEGPDLELLVVVQAPGQIFTSGGRVFRALDGLKTPPLLALTTSVGGATVERVDSHTLRVRPETGFLPHPDGTPRKPGEPVFGALRPFESFDSLFFNPSDLPELGQVFQRLGVSIQITEVDEEGYPLAAEMRFKRPLDDAAYGWVTWENGVFVPFSVPPEGEARTLDAPRLPPPGS